MTLQFEIIFGSDEQRETDLLPRLLRFFWVAARLHTLLPSVVIAAADLRYFLETSNDNPEIQYSTDRKEDFVLDGSEH